MRDLYAPMIAEGGRVLGMRVRGAWYDFGSPSLYLASHLSLMARGFRGRGRARRLIHPQARVHRAARVDRSVVGPRSAVGQGASVSGSVLWDGVRVGPGSRVNRCVLASGTQVDPGERLDKVVVVPAARLKAAPPGARLRGGRYLVQMK